MQTKSPFSTLLYRHRHAVLFCTILLLGILARVVLWPGVPGGLNQDEASNGYDAWSILHYGIDRNGMRWPVHLVAWGSGQNALYAYFSMPFIALFGLNAFSIRCVNLLFGIFALPAVYSVMKRLSTPAAALAAMFLCAISPWHIMLSRWGLDCNLFPNLFLIAVWLFVKSLDRDIWFIPAAVVFSLCFYAYGTAYVVVPMVCGLLLIYCVREAARRRRYRWWVLAVGSALFVLLAIPIALFIYINVFGGQTVHLGPFTVPRLSGVTRISTAVGFPGLQEKFNIFVRLLIHQDDGLLWNRLPDFGTVYPITLPLFLYGGWLLFRKKNIASLILLGWFGASLSVFMLYSWANINRVNIVYLPMLMIAGVGLGALCGLRLPAGDIPPAPAEKKRPQGSPRPFMAVLAAYLLLFSLFSQQYFTAFRRDIRPIFFDSFLESVQFANGLDAGATIYLTDHVNGAYLYALIAAETPPEEYLATVQIADINVEFQQVLSFDRFIIGTAALDAALPGIYVLPRWQAENYADFIVKEFEYYCVLLVPAGRAATAPTTAHPPLLPADLGQKNIRGLTV